MDTYQCIDPTQAWRLINQGACVVDIRDTNSFEQGHIQYALRVDDTTVIDFIREADLDTPLVVVCYRGISSQKAAAYFIDQGFSSVYSLEGGMAGWLSAYPQQIIVNDQPIENTGALNNEDL